MKKLESFESSELTQHDVYLWLLEVLRLVGLDDYQACFFLMNLKDPGLEWQLGTEVIRACVATGLVKLIPSSSEDGCPTDDEVLQKLSRQDPGQPEAPDATVANVWVGTYLFGTDKCRRLLARHGFLEHRMALILAEVIAQRAASVEIQSSDAKSVLEVSSASAEELRALAELSVHVERVEARELRQEALIDELDCLFSSHEVLQYRTKRT